MRASTLSRLLLVTALGALTGCPSDDDDAPAAGFAQGDLAGRWRYTILFAGAPVASGAVPGWARGTLSIDAGGVATVETYADSSGTTPVIPAISYVMDPEGVVTATASTTAFTGLHGKMNPAKTFWAATATQASGAGPRVRIAFYERIVPGTSYGDADVASGTFSFRQLVSGVSPGWLRGRLVAGADRVYSLTDLADSSGTVADMPDRGTLSVTADGVIGTTASPSFAGFLSADKQTAIGTQTLGTNDYGLTAFVRQGGSFAQADLAGRWHYLNVAVSASSASWAHGTVTFDAGGIGTFAPQVDSLGLGETPDLITLAVASDGTLTQTSPTPSVFSGVLTPAKDVLFATETHEAGVHGLIVAIR